ncbi:MAG: 2-iminoacetate synthase ThiH [Clostridia bacterium]|nr:2-iminoacetate synthase ThiH [Clostridia bacterium]
MSFSKIVERYTPEVIAEMSAQVTAEQVLEAIGKETLSEYDFLALLSPAAADYLEPMAERARKLTLQHFGRSVLLYTPMYIANHCANKCVYCSFNTANDIARMQLTMEEIEAEAKAIRAEGFKHILILTGEDRHKTPVSYIVDAVKVLKKYFECISVEIYPLLEEEYRQVIEAGVSGLTIYQETYDKERYLSLHPKGPKRNYENRLNTPEYGARAGMNFVSIGALLGLSEGVFDAFMTGLHGDYLQRHYPSVEYGLSLPRMRPHIGAFQDFTPIGDRFFVQILLAYKLFLPSMSINISTRELPSFREHLIPIGANNISAGVSTQVGGHTTTEASSDPQFEIADGRSLEEMKRVIKNLGYQPILKNWSGDF